MRATTSEDYARAAARGYRPDQPGRVPDPVWDVVQACWREDPLQRPGMATVVGALEACLEQLGPEQDGCAPQCECSVM